MRIFLAAVLAVFTAAAGAQAYPSKPIRLLVPFPPGAGTDATARILSPELSARLGQPVVVENRPGAGGVVAMTQITKAEADGHALLLATAGMLTSHVSLFKNLPYSPLKDVAPVSRVGNVPLVLVANAALAAASATELVRLAKAQPGKLTYASAGNGTAMHLSGELFKFVTGTDLVHVPYKGVAPSAAAVAAGDTTLAVTDLTSVKGLIQSARVKPLGIFSNVRSPLAPELPTLPESGVANTDALAWSALVAPAGTPPEIIRRLNAEARAVLQMQNVRHAMLNAAVEPQSSTPEELAQLIKAETAKWAQVIERSGAKVD
jgi:tripartite-type tricarboxylate transporter receptor subunit TctC